MTEASHGELDQEQGFFATPKEIGFNQVEAMYKDMDQVLVVETDSSREAWITTIGGKETDPINPDRPNQDRVFPIPNEGAVVADGFKPDGHIASEIVCQEVHHALSHGKDVHQAQKQAHQKIVEQGIKGGAAYTGFVIEKDHLEVYQAGDVRLLLIRDNQVIFETTDQRVPESQAEADKLRQKSRQEIDAKKLQPVEVVTDDYTPEFIQEHAGKLTNSVSNKKSGTTRYYDQGPRVLLGDKVVVVSDGITKNFSNQEIMDTFANKSIEEGTATLAEKTQEKMTDINQHGKADNFTIYAHEVLTTEFDEQTKILDQVFDPDADLRNFTYQNEDEIRNTLDLPPEFNVERAWALDDDEGNPRFFVSGRGHDSQMARGRIAYDRKLRKPVFIKFEVPARYEFYAKDSQDAKSFFDLQETNALKEAQIQHEIGSKNTYSINEFLSKVTSFPIKIGFMKSEIPLKASVMDYDPNPSIKELIDLKGPLSPQEIISFVTVAAEALDHQSSQEYLDIYPDEEILHHDVKPANLTLKKLLDFGLSAIKLDNDFVSGTAGYIAPEGVLGFDRTKKSDQYVLAVVVFEALTATYLYEGATVTEKNLQTILNQRFSPEVQDKLNQHFDGIGDVLRRALNESPDHRYSSSTEFANEVIRVLEPYGDAPNTIDSNEINRLLEKKPSNKF